MSLSRLENANAQAQGLKGLVPTRFAIAADVKSGLIADKVNSWILISSVILFLLQTISIAIYFKRLPPEIPLFYSRPWGSQMLAGKAFIWLIPAMALFFIFFNFLIVILFERENKFLSRVLLATSLIVGFATFYGTLKIVTLLA